MGIKIMIFDQLAWRSNEKLKKLQREKTQQCQIIQANSEIKKKNLK